jgi:hypothetical protein
MYLRQLWRIVSWGWAAMISLPMRYCRSGIPLVKSAGLESRRHDLRCGVSEKKGEIVGCHFVDGQLRT